MKLKWIADIAGGRGDEVWDDQVVFEAESFKDATVILEQVMTSFGSDCDVYSLVQDDDAGEPNVAKRLAVAERIAREDRDVKWCRCCGGDDFATCGCNP